MSPRTEIERALYEQRKRILHTHPRSSAVQFITYVALPSVWRGDRTEDCARMLQEATEMVDFVIALDCWLTQLEAR